MRTPKERVIYDNYYGWISEDDVRESIKCNDENITDEEITQEMVWEEMAFLESTYMDDLKDTLFNYMDKRICRIEGTVGLWTGRHKIEATEGSFTYLFGKAITDCDYIKLWDENGHLYLKCSHHDGTHMFEFKQRSKNSNSWVLPRFCEREWGCKAREYEVEIA